MRRTKYVFALTTAFVLAGASTLVAQRRPAPTPASKPSTSGSGGESSSQPFFTVFAGIATGTTPYDLGFALQGSWHLQPAGWPVALRIDPYLAHHSGNFGYTIGGLSSVDVTLTMIGAAGNAEYAFPATNSNVTPYALAGLGLYYGNVSFSDNISNYSISGSDTNLGFDIGGGIRFSTHFAVEAQFKSINGFHTVPILFGYRF